MFHFDNAIDVPDKSDAGIRNNNSRRVLEEEATEAEDETEVENSIEDNQIEIQQEDVYMDCSLFRSCDRCTEIEYSRILECQTGTGRIMTFRCTTTVATTTDEMTEIDPSNTLSVNTPNGDRETRSYQEYRKDDAYYNSNNNNDNLSTIESSTTALIPSSSTITTPAFLYHYESCLYTNDEYEFNYIQFQVFICLLGIISIYSIRKQKMFAASLFDQRRMKNTTTGTTAASTITNTTTTISTSNVSRTNSNASSRGIVIQRSNTGLMNSQNNNSDTNNVNNSISIEMKSLLSSGSSINDMDIV
jgi:hypothetical protein